MKSNVVRMHGRTAYEPPPPREILNLPYAPTPRPSKASKLRTRALQIRRLCSKALHLLAVLIIVIAIGSAFGVALGLFIGRMIG